MRPNFGEKKMGRDRMDKGKMDRNKDDRKQQRMPVRKKVCRFCADPHFFFDYKEPKSLIPFTTEKGKMIPRRVTGNCAFHQRRVCEAIKRARILALMPTGGYYNPPVATQQER